MNEVEAKRLRGLYFTWMTERIMPFKPERKETYTALLKKLNNTEFRYSIPMDENRLIDGLDLRYRFACDVGIDPDDISEAMEDESLPQCSILEMLVAMCIKCEEDVMYDPEFDDRTGLWFWGIIDNMGLSSMSDRNYDEETVTDILESFLDRTYAKDGRGGIAMIPAYPGDMREVEIWYQLMWHLSHRYG